MYLGEWLTLSPLFNNGDDDGEGVFNRDTKGDGVVGVAIEIDGLFMYGGDIGGEETIGEDEARGDMAAELTTLFLIPPPP